MNHFGTTYWHIPNEQAHFEYAIFGSRTCSIKAKVAFLMSINWEMNVRYPFKLCRD